jgi:menaquinone-specific isochorismate synthase
VTALIARTRPLPSWFDPLQHVPAQGAVVWAREQRSLVAWGEAWRTHPGAGDGRFHTAAGRLRSWLARLTVDDRVGAWGTGPLAFGSFTFDPDDPSSLLVVPAVVLGRDGDTAWITTLGEGQRLPGRAQAPAVPAAGARRLGSSVDDAAWLESAARARQCVVDGVLDKVVLARDVVLERDEPVVSRDVVLSLARAYPDCFAFAFDGMVGATPELLVRLRSGAVESVVLAGSAPRGETRDGDERMGERLLASAKDRREHELALQTVREPLERLCEGIEVDPTPSLLRLGYVQHLCTRVRARARRTCVLELAGALHPTAAVCGVPTDKALSAIRELEGFERGRYCGAVGWTDARGDGEWGIALRCAQLDGRRARLFSGAGIVAGSDPHAELRETEIKLRPLLEALGAEVQRGEHAR